MNLAFTLGIPDQKLLIIKTELEKKYGKMTKTGAIRLVMVLKYEEIIAKK